jgi:nucleotide-binding universal stress UspA family protein
MRQPAFPTKILVVSDGSAPSRRALRTASEICAATGSKLHVVHVKMMARGIYPDFMSDRQIDRIREEAQKRLDADIAFVQEHSGVGDAEAHVRLGRIDRQTLELAEKIGAGLIVMPNRTGDAFERVLLGNEAESVVRHAQCGVLVVREEGEP